MKKRDKVLGIDMKSNKQKGMVGFLIKKRVCKSVVKAEILLLSFALFCFSASFYFINTGPQTGF
jgi:hypothetical protein